MRTYFYVVTLMVTGRGHLTMSGETRAPAGASAQDLYGQLVTATLAHYGLPPAAAYSVLFYTLTPATLP